MLSGAFGFAVIVTGLAVLAATLGGVVAHFAWPVAIVGMAVTIGSWAQLSAGGSAPPDVPPKQY